MPALYYYTFNIQSGQEREERVEAGGPQSDELAKVPGRSHDKCSVIRQGCLQDFLRILLPCALFHFVPQGIQLYHAVKEITVVLTFNAKNKTNLKLVIVPKQLLCPFYFMMKDSLLSSLPPLLSLGSSKNQTE